MTLFVGEALVRECEREATEVQTKLRELLDDPTAIVMRRVEENFMRAHAQGVNLVFEITRRSETTPEMVALRIATDFRYAMARKPLGIAAADVRPGDPVMLDGGIVRRFRRSEDR